MMDGVNGASGSIPKRTIRGGSYTKHYSITLPSKWKPKNISLVGVVMDVGGPFFVPDISSVINTTARPLIPRPKATWPASIELTSTGNPVSMFPNPSNGNFEIEIGQNILTASMTIYTMTGKIVFTKPLYKGINKIESDLESGIYLLHTSIEGNEKEQKLVILK